MVDIINKIFVSVQTSTSARRGNERECLMGYISCCGNERFAFLLILLFPLASLCHVNQDRINKALPSTASSVWPRKTILSKTVERWSKIFMWYLSVFPPYDFMKNDTGKLHAVSRNLGLQNRRWRDARWVQFFTLLTRKSNSIFLVLTTLGVELVILTKHNKKSIWVEIIFIYFRGCYRKHE